MEIIRFQFDQTVVTRAFLGKVLWLKGLPEAALQAVERSVVDAQSIGHSLSLCYALGQGACPVALLVGDLSAAERYASLLVDHSTRHGLALWATMGRCFRGVLAIRHGNHNTGLRQLQEAVDALRNAGYALYHTASLAELADGLGRAGDVDNALRVIEEALAQSTRNEETWCRAELVRVKAELLLLRADRADFALAEDLLHQSLDWARRGSALAWQLRTATCKDGAYLPAAAWDEDVHERIVAQFLTSFNKILTAVKNCHLI